MIDFKQVDMKTGELKGVTKVFPMVKSGTEVGISMNELSNKNDSFGLIDVDPEPRTFFSIESSVIGGPEHDIVRTWERDNNEEF